MLFISIFKQHYKLILGCTVLLAVALFFAATVFFPPKYESTAVVLIPKQSPAFIPESLKGKTEWMLPAITANDLNRLISDKATQKEVGLRLLAAHLTLQSADPNSISAKHFRKLRKSISSDIWAMADSTDNSTYLNLVKHADTHPYLIELINHPKAPYYSNAAISSVSASRIGNSDVTALSYISDDAGISRKTLEIVLDVCTRHYINLNTERNNKIAAYYEEQFQNAENELRASEERTRNARRKDILKQLFAAQDKLSESENSLKTIENQLGMQNPVVKNQIVIDKQHVLNSLYVQWMTSSTGAKIDTVALQILIVQAQNDLKHEIAMAIADLPGEEETKIKVTREYGDAMVTVERDKVRLAASERQRKTLYSSLKLPAHELDMLEACDQKYLGALDEMHKNNRYQQSQRVALPIQIIEQPNSHAISKYWGIVWAVLSCVAGFVISFSLIAARVIFSKKLKTPKKAEQMTGLKVAGIVPNNKQLQSCKNANHIRDSLLHQLFWNFSKPAKKQHRVLVASIHPEDGKTFVCGLMDGWLSRKGRKCKVVTPSDDLIPIESLTDIDVLIMKLPPLSTGEYPVELIRKFNAAYLVCNANKEWLPSDSKVIAHFMEQSKQTPRIILNNVDLNVVEEVLERISKEKTSPQRNSQRGDTNSNGTTSKSGKS